jgi:hypothetical protein
MSRIYLSANDKIEKFENHLVKVTLTDGTVFEGLEPRRLFPVSSPNTYVTLLDESGVEKAVLRAFSDIDKASAGVILDSLEDYYLVPRILRILSKAEKYGTLRWTVETDRGICAFDIRNRFHDIQVARSGFVRVRDANDNRYIIEDANKLDKKSYALLMADT